MPAKKLQSETWGERRPNIVQKRMTVGNQDVGLQGQTLADALESADRVTEGLITEEEAEAEGPKAQNAAPDPDEGQTEPAAETPEVGEPEPQATVEDDQPTELERPERDETPAQVEEPARDEAPAEETVTLPRAEYDEMRRQQLMHADYTRKTQATAELRKELDSALAATRVEREQYTALIKQVEELLSDADREPDWATERQRLTPEQYADLRDVFAQRKRDRDAAAAERKRVEQKAAEDRKKQQDSFVETEREKLFTVMPELRDPKVLTPWLERMRSTARSLGFTDAEFNGANDHRMFIMLNRAAKGGTPSTNRPQTTKPQVSRPRSVGPGATPRVQVPKNVQDKARERMHKEQSVSAAGDFIATLEGI